MDKYEELLGRVVDLETQLGLMRAQKDAGVDNSVLLERVGSVEITLHELKQELMTVSAESLVHDVDDTLSFEFDAFESSAPSTDDTRRFEWTPSEVQAIHDSVMQSALYEEVRPTIEGQAFRVRNVRQVPNQRTGGTDEVTTWEGRGGRVVTGIRRGAGREKNMEFQVGKTVMSVLASILILCSLVLFGGLIYPFLSDGMKVVIMYAISVAFIGIGLVGRDWKFRTFFTAMAGCGVGAFYLSGIISYFLFNAFGLGVLFVLTYAWVCVVAWVSKQKVPIFAYICYIGILISTFLCVFQFPGSVAALGCYLLSITTLYLFNRTKNYQRDVFYFVQFPIVMLVLGATYMENSVLVMWLMLACAVVYVIQHYLYKEESRWCLFCMVATEVALFGCYQICNTRTSPGLFLNIVYVFLTGLVSVWSFLQFQDRILKYGPLCVMSLLLPILDWGSLYESFIGFAPFAMVTLLLGYLLGIDLMKGIACGYMLGYIISRPPELSWFQFDLVMVAFIIEFGVLLGTLAYSRHRDRAGFALVSFASLLTMCNDEVMPVTILAYCVAIVFSAIFNSSFFVADDFSQRLGWGWNGFWMSYGAAGIVFATPDENVKVVFFFLAVLVAIVLNMKWQLECENIGAGIELCIKWSIYLWMLISRLTASGVVMSVAFLLLAIWCIVLGAIVKRRIIRIYGLVLSITSVVKCLLIDIQYSSSIYRPIGLFVAGVLCFGISLLYSAIERRLRDDSEE